MKPSKPKNHAHSINRPGYSSIRWYQNSADGGLLYLLFEERVFHPCDYRVSLIQDHPLLPFKKYLPRTMAPACHSMSRLCTLKEKWGNGVLRADFARHVEDAKKKNTKLIKMLKELKSSDDSSSSDSSISL